MQPWSHQATNQGRSIKKSWLSHILQDVATRCFMSYTVAPPQRSAFVQSLFSPHCTVSQSLPNTLTYGQSAPFSDLFTYLRFGWCSAPRARPGSHSFQWSSGIAPGITKQTKKRKWNYFLYKQILIKWAMMNLFFILSSDPTIRVFWGVLFCAFF